jgi:hypothetical protein
LPPRGSIQQAHNRSLRDWRGSREQLVFQTDPEHRWRILKLVNDDYLMSLMTNHRYEVDSKTAPPV